MPTLKERISHEKKDCEELTEKLSEMVCRLSDASMVVVNL
jgi:hypothetical protein